jgi:hypothetical protein
MLRVRIVTSWSIANGGVSVARGLVGWVLYLAASLMTTMAVAQQPIPASVDAMALLDRWGFDAKFNQNVPTCIRPSGTRLDPHAALAINADYFGGVRPGKAEWPEIEAIYKRIQTVVCGPELQRRWKGLVAARLDATLSARDLRTALLDQSSPASKAVAETLDQVEISLWANANQVVAVAIELTVQEFQAEVDAVVRKARSN